MNMKKPEVIDGMKKPEEKPMDMKNHEVIDGMKKPEQVVKQGLNKLKYII